LFKSAFFIYNTTGFWDRICVPTDLDLIKNTNITDVLTTSDLEKYFNDLRTAWKIIFAGAGIAFLVGFIYMFIMRYCVGIFTWLTIFAYFIILIFLSYYLLKKG